MKDNPIQKARREKKTRKNNKQAACKIGIAEQGNAAPNVPTGKGVKTRNQGEIATERQSRTEATRQAPVRQQDSAGQNSRNTKIKAQERT
ncbi:hypothetical protein [Halomonas cupida]|uniref:Uncharacterized protein n=1 Tax=Halomonas cupida TaxID=44933 RepID=A0A1M7JIN1_9GAMM|nr:hypothetical protein [Halomonas cupida]SHM52959.1 hypothetical protein SAMN05660971_03186 [Halomonas cupida]